MSHFEELLDSDTEREHHERRARIAGMRAKPFEPPRSCHVVLNRRRLRYLDWGQPGGDPILFLHGGGQTARTWDMICHELCLDQHRRALALDQRGHGDSEWAYDFDYGPDAHARDILGLVDHLGLQRLTIVGMSMGCMNGLRFALDHPNRVRAFVAVDAGPWMNVSAGRRIFEFVERSRELESIDAYVQHAMAFNPRRHPELLKQSLLHNLRQLPNGNWTWKSDRRNPNEYFQRIGVELEKLQRDIASLDCPLLVVRGAESDIFLDEHAERLASAVGRGSWKRIVDSGHAVQGDQPRLLVAAIEEFLGAPS